MDACKTFPADNMNISDQPEQYLKNCLSEYNKAITILFLDALGVT